MSTTVQPYCDYCRAGALCGVDKGEALPDCAVLKVERGIEPSNADVVRLIAAMALGTTQQLAQVMLLISHHSHQPDGRVTQIPAIEEMPT